MVLTRDELTLPQDFPCQINRYRLKKDENKEDHFHYHDFCEVTYIEQGHGRYLVNGRDYRVQAGDIVLGLPSSGVHSNGYSLVRKVFDVEHCDLGAVLPELGRPLGEALLTPTRIYVLPVLQALETGAVHGISHITGGGFYENIPRCLPDGLCARLEKAAVPVLPVFRVIQERGGIPERDMFNTFNMGIGMSLVVARDRVDDLRAILPEAVILGEIVPGEEKLVLC